MSPHASAPFWVRALLGAALAAGTVPAWLFVAGHALYLVTYRGKGPSADLFAWPRAWSQRQPTAPARPLVLSGGAATLVLIAPLALLLYRPPAKLYGDARHARRADIARAGILKDASDGVLIGRLGRRFLSASLDRYPHLLLAAPTGSGKGVGVVIPNLLTWNHSVVVTDIKHENWHLTAGYRAAHGHAVYLFDPANPEGRTHRWNPLTYVRDTVALRVDDIQKIGALLFPDVDGVDPIWAASCRSLFLGLVLYLFETEGKPRTLGQVAREIYRADDQRFAALIQSGSTPHPLSDVCRGALADYLGTSDNTRTSIRKTFSSRFELFLNPIVDAATAGNDFDLRNVRKERISIYIGITPDNLLRMAPLLNLFYQQLVDLNARELPERNPALRFQCLLLFDEFRALGKLPLIVTSIAYLRGYGLRLLSVFQSPSQIREVYGTEAAKTFFENHHVQIVYTPANFEVASDISRDLGTFTAKSRSVSRPQAFSNGSRSLSESDHSRALMLPQEVKEIGDDEVLLFVKGCRPIRAEKIRWYRDRDLRGRVRPPPAVPVAPPAVSPPNEAPHTTRPVESGDIESLANRPLSDFSLDFSGVEVPHGELSQAEAEALADRVYQSLVR